MFGWGECPTDVDKRIKNVVVLGAGASRGGLDEAVMALVSARARARTACRDREQGAVELASAVMNARTLRPETLTQLMMPLLLALASMEALGGYFRLGFQECSLAHLISRVHIVGIQSLRLGERGGLLWDPRCLYQLLFQPIPVQPFVHGVCLDIAHPWWWGW